VFTLTLARKFPRRLSGFAAQLLDGRGDQRPGERLEATAKRADLLMFEAKRKRYAEAGQDRRREAASAA
jgi:hypothetical protein